MPRASKDRKAQEMKPRATLRADGFTQKSLHQTIRLFPAAAGELFR
jgi:hypothetical protein